MLTIYRRHLKNCEHRGEGRSYRRCRCPIWVDGFIDGQEIRQSLKTRDWTKANRKVQEWEAAEKKPEPKPEDAPPKTIAYACAEYLADAKARELRDSTLYKHQLLFRQLEEFAREHGFRYLPELNLETVRAFRSSWLDHNLAALKKLGRLRAFFRFGVDSGWITENPASKLKNPQISDPPTEPLERHEVAKILGACADYPDRRNAVRLRALVLLLRYSGLRIRDAVMLNRDRIHGDMLFLRTAKTGVQVRCPLPPLVTEALEAIPTAGPYFFWTGESLPKSCVGDWQRSLRRLFRLAGVPSAHAHRFRDTFAVELLLIGTPLERVSALLGHQSVKVTEKHYKPWVRALQEQLEADVRRSWATDLISVPEMKGTFGVHEKTKHPN